MLRYQEVIEVLARPGRIFHTHRFEDFVANASEIVHRLGAAGSVAVGGAFPRANTGPANLDSAKQLLAAMGGMNKVTISGQAWACVYGKGVDPKIDLDRLYWASEERLAWVQELEEARYEPLDPVESRKTGSVRPVGYASTPDFSARSLRRGANANARPTPTR